MTYPPVEFILIRNENQDLTYQIRRWETVIIEPSPLGMIIEGEGTLSPAASVRLVQSREFKDEFPARGNKFWSSVRGRETVYQLGEGEEPVVETRGLNGNDLELTLPASGGAVVILKPKGEKL